MRTMVQTREVTLEQLVLEELQKFLSWSEERKQRKTTPKLRVASRGVPPGVPPMSLREENDALLAELVASRTRHTAERDAPRAAERTGIDVRDYALACLRREHPEWFAPRRGFRPQVIRGGRGA